MTELYLKAMQNAENNQQGALLIFLVALVIVLTGWVCSKTPTGKKFIWIPQAMAFMVYFGLIAISFTEMIK